MADTEWQDGFPKQGGRLCPSCGSMVDHSQTVCANCRYDFVTGTGGESTRAPVLADSNVAVHNQGQKRFVIVLAVTLVIFGAVGAIFFAVSNQVDDLTEFDFGGGTGGPGEDDPSGGGGDYRSCVDELDRYMHRLLGADTDELGAIFIDASNDLGGGSFEFQALARIYSQVAPIAELKSEAAARRRARTAIRRECRTEYRA